MDTKRLDASWEKVEAWGRRCKALWQRAKQVYHAVLRKIAIPLLLLLLGFVVWAVWKAATDPASRHAASQAASRQLKWYLIWVTACWVASKVWNWLRPKKKEAASGTQQEGVRKGQPKDRRKDHRRVQGR